MSEAAPSIVLADDEQRVADAQARLLPDHCDVTVVYGGSEALEAIDETTDLAILDRQMPDLTGDEVVRAVREAGIDCPVVMITAVEPDFDIMDLGVEDYLVKPVSQADLEDVVETWIGGTDAAETLQEYFSLSAKWETLEEYKSDEEIEKRVLDSLHSATTALMEADDEDEIAAIATKTAYRVLQFPGTELLTYETGSDVLSRRAVDGLQPADDQTTALADTPQGEAFCSQETVIYRADEAALGPFDAAMYVPLGNDGVLGVGKIDADSFTETERKFTETLAENVRVALAQVRREQDLAFLSDVLSRVLRHNIRNDLSNVIGLAGELHERLGGRDRELVERVLEQSRDVVQQSEKARVVEEVMTGQARETRQDVTDLLAAATDQIADRYPHAEIVSDLPATAPATGVPSLRQAFVELLDNAVVPSDAERPRVEVRASAETDLVTVAVVDDGPGIPTHELEMLDQQEETDLSHGSGVGLYLADWIVEQSGGSLAFDVTDAGTTVEVTLSTRTVALEGTNGAR